MSEGIKAFIDFNIQQVKVELTNRKWFSVVCTLIDNDIRHHSGQNVVDSRGAASAASAADLFFATIFNAKESFYFRA